jgi:hypothetical protein
MALAVMTMVVSIVGFIVALVLNTFVLDKYNAYGEVPIPGRASLQLPAGDVTITFHTMAIGSPSGGLPIPDLRMNLQGPDGGSDPAVTESLGTTTSVNNDIRRRVWIAHVPAEGTYDVITDGKVSAFINPTLAFGHSSSLGFLPWAFVALFGFSLVALVIALVWSSRLKSRAGPAVAMGQPLDFGMPTVPTQPARSYLPTDDGVRIEQLKTLAALRDSGALTEKEFEAEKRRLLGGG